mgnify:CR=1 FL=1
MLRYDNLPGIYAYSGCVTPLNRVVELKNQFKYRLLLDDSFAIGVLGKTGHGTPEQFNVPVCFTLRSDAIVPALQ